jgi:hypothetical protein
MELDASAGSEAVCEGAALLGVGGELSASLPCCGGGAALATVAGCASGESGTAAPTAVDCGTAISRETSAASPSALGAPPWGRGDLPSRAPASATVSLAGGASNKKPLPKKTPMIAMATAPIRTSYSTLPTGRSAAVVRKLTSDLGVDVTGISPASPVPKSILGLEVAVGSWRGALRRLNSGSALAGRRRPSSEGVANISPRITRLILSVFDRLDPNSL